MVSKREKKKEKRKRIFMMYGKVKVSTKELCPDE
jgi:hypothetical protein